MSIDPVALSTLAAGISLIGEECLKGLAGEAGKSAWAGIKDLLGWKLDPVPAEISDKASDALRASPEIADRLLELLKASKVQSATQLVGEINASGHAKVLVVQNANQIIM